MRSGEQRSDADRAANIRIVLVRPLGSANVGAAARAMKNMGLGRADAGAAGGAPLRRRRGDGGARPRRGARRAAWSARVAAAVADCALVVGTTCRGGPYRAGAEPRRGDGAAAAGGGGARAGGGAVRTRGPRPDQRRPARLPAPDHHRHQPRLQPRSTSPRPSCWCATSCAARRWHGAAARCRPRRRRRPPTCSACTTTCSARCCRSASSIRRIPST